MLWKQEPQARVTLVHDKDRLVSLLCILLGKDSSDLDQLYARLITKNTNNPYSTHRKKILPQSSPLPVTMVTPTYRKIRRFSCKLAPCNLHVFDTFFVSYNQDSTVDKRHCNFQAAEWWAGEAEVLELCQGEGEQVPQWFQGGEVELHLNKDKKAMLWVLVKFRLKCGA